MHRLRPSAKRGFAVFRTYLGVCGDLFTGHIPLMNPGTVAKCHEIDAEIAHQPELNEIISFSKAVMQLKNSDGGRELPMQGKMCLALLATDDSIWCEAHSQSSQA